MYHHSGQSKPESNGNSTHPRIPEMESYHQIQFSVIPRTFRWILPYVVSVFKALPKKQLIFFNICYKKKTLLTLLEKTCQTSFLNKWPCH